MKITIEYIRRTFSEFNVLFFGGKLAEIPFRISRARTFLGAVRCKKKRRIFGGWKYYDFEFVISSKTDYIESEREVEDIILHEMIHYYILSNQIQDSGPHGMVFKRIARDLNERFGRHVTTRHKRTAEEADRDMEERQHLVCVVRFSDGRMGITIAARTRLFLLWDALPGIPNVEECTWYITTEPYFNRFPRAMTPKIYAVNAEEMKPHLTTAKRLMRCGDRITIKPI